MPLIINKIKQLTPSNKVVSILTKNGIKSFLYKIMEKASFNFVL